MSFDLAASLRRLKPEKRTAPSTRRPDDALSFVAEPVVAGAPIMLDTTVYIDALQDRLPGEVIDLLKVRQPHHSAVAVAELAHGLGRLDPGHAGTEGVAKAIKTAIARIPRHRLAAPSARTLIEAGILSGLVVRARSLRSSHQSLYNDAVLYLQALEQGCTLLSRNIIDLDALQQAFPNGRVLFYRQLA